MKHSIFLPLIAAALLPMTMFSDVITNKLSTVERSIFFRNGSGTRGNAGFNSGRYSKEAFNGNFEDYMQQNVAGAELVIPTTKASTGKAWYVTEILIGHKGNTQYSLYYTTEVEPTTILSNGYDPRSWTAIPGATNIMLSGKKTYPVGVVATAVKYVFDTTIEWTPSIAEVEVWGVDPDELGCLHQNKTEWGAIPATANCTRFGLEQQQCLDCGEWFYRDSQTILPLGHDYQTVLLERGTSLTFGSGTNVCKRCGEEIAFSEPQDLARLGGVATVGVVQFTDLTVSSTGNPDYGVRPDLLIDNAWAYTWPYWYAASKSTSEYVQFDFANAIDLTAVEISVPNRAHTLEFYSVSGSEEELIGERLVEYDSSLTGNNSNQCLTNDFRGVTLRTLRIKSDDASNALAIYECHPYGTVAGAGKSAAVRTRVIIE